MKGEVGEVKDELFQCLKILRNNTKGSWASKGEKINFRINKGSCLFCFSYKVRMECCVLDDKNRNSCFMDTLGEE